MQLAGIGFRRDTANEIVYTNVTLEFFKDLSSQGFLLGFKED